MMHSHIVAFPSFLQTHYIRNIAVVKKFCFRFVFISLGKQHPLWWMFHVQSIKGHPWGSQSSAATTGLYVPVMPRLWICHQSRQTQALWCNLDNRPTGTAPWAELNWTGHRWYLEIHCNKILTYRQRMETTALKCRQCYGSSLPTVLLLESGAQCHCL